MYYGEIKNCDIDNGEGVRVTLFVSGCTNHCIPRLHFRLLRLLPSQIRRPPALTSLISILKH